MADNKPSKPSFSLSPASLKAAVDPIVAPIRKHSTFIMMMIAFGMIAYSAIMVSTILQQSDDQAYRDEQATGRISSKFDDATIEKIDNLRESAENSSIELPSGRRNPFTN